MKSWDEADPGSEESGTGLLLVSVFITCIGLLARPDQV